MKFYILPIICLALAVAFIWTSLKEQALTERLTAEGRQATCVVTAKDRRDNHKRSDDYYLTVSFVTEIGDPVVARKSVGSTEYHATQIGAEMPVIYVASDPNAFRLNGHKGGEKALKGVGLFLAVVGAGLLIYALFFRKKKKEVVPPPLPA